MTTVQEEESIFLEGSHLDHQVRGSLLAMKMLFFRLSEAIFVEFQGLYPITLH